MSHEQTQNIKFEYMLRSHDADCVLRHNQVPAG